MPFTNDPNLDPQQQQNSQPFSGQVSGGLSSGAAGQNQSQNQATQQAPSVAGGAGTTGAAGVSSGQSYNPSAPTSPQPFANIQNYLNANQQSGRQLGQNVASQLGQSGQQAQQDLQNAQQAFANNAAQNTVNYNDQATQAYLANPTQTNSNEATQVANQLAANYGGYQNANQSQGFQNASNEASNAAQQGQAAQTEGGRFALLNQYFKNPGYTQGQQSLDNALLTQNFSPVQQQIQQYQNLPAQVQAAQNQANQQAAQAQATTQATKGQTQQAIGINPTTGQFAGTQDANGNWTNGGAIGGILNQINNQVAQNNQAAQLNYQNLESALSNPTITPVFDPTTGEQLGGTHPVLNLSAAQAAEMGLNPGQTYYYSPQDVSNLQGITDFLTPAGTANANNSASADEVARLGALAQMAGLNQSWVNPAATPFNPNPTFNTAGLLNEQQNIKNIYSDNGAAPANLAAAPEIITGNQTIDPNLLFRS